MSYFKNREGPWSFNHPLSKVHYLYPQTIEHTDSGFIEVFQKFQTTLKKDFVYDIKTKTMLPSNIEE